MNKTEKAYPTVGTVEQAQAGSFLTDGRTVRRMIAEERFAGVPILANNQTGYYLPANEDERRRCVRSMRHRAKEIDRAAQAIEAADIPQDYRKSAQRVPEASTWQMRMEGV